MPLSEIAAVARALRAIESLASRDMSVSELAHTFGIDRGTAARLMNTLGRAGYVERSPADRTYRVVATKIISLYGLVEGRVELTQLAAPVQADLRDKTNETANLSVLVDDEMLHVAQVRSRAWVSTAIGLGRRVPVHCSAVGKAFIAFLPAERVSEMLARRGQAEFTLRTITSPSALKAHLETVRQVGYSIDDEESEFGMRCVAAPVRDHTGRVIASIGISGPSTRLTLQKLHEYSEHVLAAARRLSTSLGADPSASQRSDRAGRDADRGRQRPRAPGLAVATAVGEPGSMP